MTFSVNTKIHPRLRSILLEVGPETRRQILSVGAEELANLVRAHLRRIAPLNHRTATRLGASPTMRLEEGSRLTVASASADGAVVSVPLAGISRAFHNLVITPKKASALTIPVAAAAYGHTVRELKRSGWKVFRPGPKSKPRDVLMGAKNGEPPKPLFALRKQVVVPQDRSLLPSDDEVAAAVNFAAANAFNTLKRLVP